MNDSKLDELLSDLKEHEATFERYERALRLIANAIYGLHPLRYDDMIATAKFALDPNKDPFEVLKK